tara:strand:- start:1392 stop:1904 length:513 start_codon:yes stop_codon:yes gene_type:complete
MKTIFLLRHAKSSWDNTKLEDFDRPLATRGIKSCKKIGKFFKKKKLVPDIVYCSTAVRAKQTWDLINRIVEKKKNIIYEDQLYMANSSIFMNFVKKTNDNFKTLMIVSHNPGIENFAIELIKNKESDFYKDINLKYPTGGIAIINFKLKHWSKMNYETGDIYEFIKPREL